MLPRYAILLHALEDKGLLSPLKCAVHVSVKKRRSTLPIPEHGPTHRNGRTRGFSRESNKRMLRLEVSRPLTVFHHLVYGQGLTSVSIQHKSSDLREPH